MSSDALNGQHNSRHHESSEQTASVVVGRFNRMSLYLLRKYQLCQKRSKQTTFLCDITFFLFVSSLAHSCKICWSQCLNVFPDKLTDFPVPGFQWYPNTSSRFTVLLCSTSFSSSSLGRKRKAHKHKPQKVHENKNVTHLTDEDTFSSGGKWTNPR